MIPPTKKKFQISFLLVNDQPIELSKLYSVCACEREGDAPDMLCRMPGVKDAVNTKYSLHQVLKDYLKENSPVSPLPEGNAIILDAPKQLLSQVTDVDYQFS